MSVCACVRVCVCPLTISFGQNLIIQSAGVTLKMRSRTPKSNHFFSPSQYCGYASLVKFHPLVQEIKRRQDDADVALEKTVDEISVNG